MNAYNIFLYSHSGIRWILLLLAVAVIVRSIIGLRGKPYQKIDKILATSFVGTVHLMSLLGLVLYFFLSPLTQQAFADFGSAMKDSTLRFWAVEHLVLMILAITLATIGSVKTKKATSDQAKFKNQLFFYGLSLVLMLISIPWDRV